MYRHRRRSWTVGIPLLVVSLVAPTPSLAAASPAGPSAGTAGEPAIRPVSGDSPFASCTLDASGVEPFDVHSEVEPWIAINPVNEANRVVAWQQDRWFYGSARGAVTAVTKDGGRSWRRVVMPITLCAGGPYGRITNPWLAFGPDGRLHATVMAAALDPLSTGIAVLSSEDGGQSWSSPTEIVSNPMSDYFNDKPALTVDPRNPRRLYLVWNRRHLTDDTHSLLFSRSTDGGRTWESPRPIHQPVTARGTIGNQIVVLSDGTLLNVFHEGPFAIGLAGGSATSAGEDEIRVMRSTDAGRTWSAPSTIATVRLGQPVLPGTTAPIVGASLVPDVAVDSRDRVHIVWNDAGLSTSGSAVALTVSSDRGRSWTRPRRVNATPDSPAGGSGQVFVPQVDTGPDGTIAVTYYDLRRDSAAAGTPADQWIATCRGTSCATSAAPWRERHLGGPFDLEKAIRWFGGPFLGTYTGLAHTRGRFVSTFVMTNEGPGDPQDVHVTSVPLHVSAPTT